MNKLLSIVLTLILASNTMVTYGLYRTYLFYAHRPKAQCFVLRRAVNSKSIMANLYNLTIDDLKGIPKYRIISRNPLIVQTDFRSTQDMRKSVPSDVKCVYFGEI